MTRLLFALFCLAVFVGCSPLSKSKLTKRMKGLEHEMQDHTGFILVDPARRETIFEYQSDRYFTPASNTKIFTLFASLKLLGDSVPALHYLEKDDSVIIWGTGDPSLFYRNVYDDGRTFAFLAEQEKPLYLSTSNFNTSTLGNGWSWDDYNSIYSTERSPFPIFGNAFRIRADKDSIQITPGFFRQFYHQGDMKERTQIRREVHSNDFTFHWGMRRSLYREWDVPMRIDQQLIADLLSDTLAKPVVPVKRHYPGKHNVQTIYSIPVDSLYSEMMQESDNFIAEQLLLMCADVVSDTLQPEIAIDFVKKNYLNDLPDEPSWVDGSGLSRYNLFTPRSVAKLWEKIYGLVPQQRLFPLLATGGVNGTVKNWYRGDNGPYFFGKTGTLSNVHCLSGYLVTKSGKVLIFSFMHNNYVEPTSKVRAHMQELLKLIHDRY